jgi:hypothetical protein
MEVSSPMQMNCVEKDVLQELKNIIKVATMIIGVSEVTGIPDRQQCQFRNNVGWVVRSADISAHNHQRCCCNENGNLTVRPWSIVTKFCTTETRKEQLVLKCLMRTTNKTYIIMQNNFLNASTLNSDGY